MNKRQRLHALHLAAALVLAYPYSAMVHAANVTTCTAIKMCYCSNADFKAAIDEKVAYFRAAMAEQRAKGRAVGYLSIPLSTVGGGYFNVNREVAAKAKHDLERPRHGSSIPPRRRPIFRPSTVCARRRATIS